MAPKRDPLPPREKIPSKIKREVRQQAGFGCCKCGRPIYEYHHIVERSEESDDILLLCPNDHDMATKGVMTLPEQREYKKNPYNLKIGLVRGTLEVKQETPIVLLGGNIMEGNSNLVVVDGEPLVSISVDEGILEISVRVYNEDDVLLFQIDKNEWITGVPIPWDIEADYQRLTIRSKHRDIIALSIDAKKSPMEIHSNLWSKGQNFRITPTKILYNGIIKDIGIYGNYFVNSGLCADTRTGTFSIG